MIDGRIPAKEKIAIVGGGISGLGCAYFLHRDHDVTVFEHNDYPGGHSNTVSVRERGREVGIDTGFMVFNEVTYPHLTRLFKTLGVASKPTEMSLSVQHLEDGLEWNAGDFNLFFGQRRNLWRLAWWKVLWTIDRFNKDTVKSLDAPEYAGMTLREYVTHRGYGENFMRWYLVPMTAAVWSCPPERVLEFPAATLMRFWFNHGFLGMESRHPWRTVEGGSRTYVRKLIAPFAERVKLGRPATKIRCRAGGKGVVISFQDGAEEHFDRVILASHADESLGLLADPTAMERAVLGKFAYQPNRAVLHSDPRFMPKTRRCWAAWNCVVNDPVDGSPQSASTHYWMNNLQGVSKEVDYFVSINPPVEPAADKVHREISYTHPIFDLGAIAAQKEVPALNLAGAQTCRHYVGAWTRYGFHEDGLLSAVKLCEQLLGRDPWS